MRVVTKISSGFSLIELMVVIAIVALLSAVAVPAYNEYIIRTNASTIQTAMNNAFTRATIYRNEHGNFPNARELGYEVDPLNPGDNFIRLRILGSAWDDADGTGYFGVQEDGVGVGDCSSGDILLVHLYLQTSYLGIDDPGASMNIWEVLIDTDPKTTVRVCEYFIYDGTTMLTTDPYGLLEDCTYNGASPTSIYSAAVTAACNL